jgi:hypothetical protein
MKVKFNLMALAIASLAAFSAQAAITPGTGVGNSSVLFVAQDNGLTESIVIDLGVNLADFLQIQTNLIATAGTLSAAGTAAVWNFGAVGAGGDTRTVNGSAVTGDYNWSSTLATFIANASGGYKWGVIAGDNNSSTTLDATNTIKQRNFLATGATTTQANINGLSTSTPIVNANNNLTNFIAGNVGGTHATNAEGAQINVSGGGYLNPVMKGTAGGNLTWNYLANVGVTQNVFNVNNVTNPIVYQLGSSYGVDTLLTSDAAATFTFDGSTLTYTVPTLVPEPGTYAMLLAGLAAVGFISRRRSA